MLRRPVTSSSPRFSVCCSGASTNDRSSRLYLTMFFLSCSLALSCAVAAQLQRRAPHDKASQALRSCARSALGSRRRPSGDAICTYALLSPSDCKLANVARVDGSVQLFKHRLADQELGAELLVERLQPRRRVDRVADHRVPELALSA